jgi:hypothetical protein
VLDHAERLPNSAELDVADVIDITGELGMMLEQEPVRRGSAGSASPRSVAIPVIAGS